MKLTKCFLSKDKTILNITIFLVGFSIPFSFAFNSICIGLFIIVSLFYFDKSKIMTLFSYKEVYFYFILFYIIQLISYFYSANKNLAFDNLSRNFLFFILPISFLIIKNKLNRTSFKALFYGLLISILLFLFKVYSLLLIDLIASPFFQIKNFLRENFIEKGIYKIHVPYFSMLILLVLIFSIKNNFIKNNTTKTVLIFILSISLIFISGLMSFFIFLFFIFYLFLKSKIKKIKKITISITLLLIISITFFSIKNLSKMESERGAESILFRTYSLINSKNNSFVRIQNWNSVIDVISENLFFGVGVDGGINELLKHREPLTEPFVNKHNAHNIYLETILRYGIFGFIIFGILLFLLLKKASQGKNFFYLWFLIVFLTSSLTESFLQRQVGLVVFTFFSLFFYSINNNHLDLRLNK